MLRLCICLLFLSLCIPSYLTAGSTSAGSHSSILPFIPPPDSLAKDSTKLSKKEQVKKDEKEPASLMGFEPFMLVGMALTLGGVFVFALLPLGILSMVFGFVRTRAKPKAWKGKKRSLLGLILGITIPVYAFVVRLVFFGNVKQE